MWSIYEEYLGTYKAILNEYIPDFGEGKSLASQTVTAVHKLVRGYFNNGDFYDTTRSRFERTSNNISCYANWLYANGGEETRHILDGIWVCEDEVEYEYLLKNLAEVLLQEDELKGKAKQPSTGTIYICEGPYDASDPALKVPAEERELPKDETYEGFDIYKYGREKILEKYTGKGGDVIIPDGVTEIGEDAFRDCEDVTGVTIPASVYAIGAHAFEGCHISDVVIPDSVGKIGRDAFKIYGLRHITINEMWSNAGGEIREFEAAFPTARNAQIEYTYADYDDEEE